MSQQSGDDAGKGFAMKKELFEPGTPVEVLVGGQWRSGYYQGLSGWKTCHIVTVKKSKRSGRWRIDRDDYVRKATGR